MRTGLIAATASSASGPGAPGAVRNLVATPGVELAFLSWTAPVSNGGSAITNHEFQSALAAGEANGTLDTTFTTNTGTAFNEYARSIAIQSDGKIVVGGNFTTFNGTTVNRIVRFSSSILWSNTALSGSSDTSYTFTGLSSSVEYVLRARVVNAIGVSPWVETSTPVTPSVAAVVTGGTLTSDSTYYYRTFTSSGTLSISAAPLDIDYALCSGGEGGSGYTSPILTSNPTTTATGGRGALVTQGSTSGASGSISIVVGAGGLGGIRRSANDDPLPPGAAYGTASSIGAVSSVTDNTTYADGAFVSVPTGLAQPTSRRVNGGGAGSSANGGNASVTPGGVGGSVFGGNGGPGTTVFGVTLGGGGGAASMTLTDSSGPYTYTGVAGAGGSGGGGAGGLNTTTSPANGTANTGGGGGGGINVTGAYGGTGGSGIVIVRYLKTAVGG